MSGVRMPGSYPTNYHLGEFSFGFGLSENMVSRVVMFLEKFRVAEIKVRRGME